MKKLLILTAIAAMAATAHAQIPQGTLYLGGSLGFGSTTNKTKVGSTTTDGPKYSNFNFSPEVGYFLADNLAVGLAFNISSNKTVQKNPSPGVDETKTTTTANGLTLYGRKFFNMTDNFSLFAGLDLNFGGGKTKNESTGGGTTVSSETKNSMMGANLNAGVAFAVTPKITIYGKWGFLGFTSQKEKYKVGSQDAEDKSSSFGLNVNTYNNPFTVGMYFSF